MDAPVPRSVEVGGVAVGRGSRVVLRPRGGGDVFDSAVAGKVAEAGGNITDLTTRLAGGLYILGAEVDLPRSADVAELETSLRVTAERLGVGVAVRRMESDEL